MNQILEGLSHDPTQGSLRYRGVRYLLIRPETLHAIWLGLEAELGSQRAGELFFRGGFEGGRLSGTKYRQDFELSDEEAVAFMCRMGGEIGWGHFRLLGLNADGPLLLAVEVDGSPFAEAAGNHSPSGACHLIRGVLAGLAHGLYGEEVVGRETMCVSMGDHTCRFETWEKP